MWTSEKPVNYISFDHSKGLDESYLKMQVLSNLSNFVKSYGHLNNFGVLTTSTH